MKWVSLQDMESSNFPPLQQPYLLPPPSKQILDSSNGVFYLNDKISPTVLLIIIVLAIVFFVSGLLHLLVRFLLRPGNRDTDDLDNVTALEGQLQQLFHLHDSGVDQSFIDNLPVFNYEAIIGLKSPFDCAVCLCEFEPENKLRLLPKCSHAFHMECIDTWLLSHSTCPLCRGNLLHDLHLPPNNGRSPIVLVLESGSESSEEDIENSNNHNNVIGWTNSVLTSNSHLGFQGDNVLGSSRLEISHKSCEIFTKVESLGEKIVSVKLGKYRNVDMGEGSGNVEDGRRCFSMGSFEYVMDENSSLQVAIRTPMKNKKKPTLPLTPGHRHAMSECDLDTDAVTRNNGNSFSRTRRENFSISKIWLRGEKGMKGREDCLGSRRAFSFRIPRNRNFASGGDDSLKMKKGDFDGRRTKSVIGIGRWENRNGFDEENQSWNGKTPSFATTSLQWLLGSKTKLLIYPSQPNV